jgi:hypothetical protein
MHVALELPEQPLEGVLIAPDEPREERAVRLVCHRLYLVLPP